MTLEIFKKEIEDMLRFCQDLPKGPVPVTFIVVLVERLEIHAFGAVQGRQFTPEVRFRRADKALAVAGQMGGNILDRPISCGARLGHSFLTNFCQESIPLPSSEPQFI